MSFNVDGLPEKVRELIRVVDKGDKLEVTHGYIDDFDLYNKTRDAIEGQDGKCLGWYANAMHYKIVKGPTSNTLEGKPTVKESHVTVPTISTDEYDLKLSREKLGALVPILTDAHGNIIDGFHRLEIDSNWPRIKLENVIDPVQLEMARIAINQCRRVVDTEERAKGYGKLIELTKWTPKQLADNMGIPYRTIMRYLPDKFKEKSWEREPIAKVAIEHESVKTKQPSEVTTAEINKMFPPLSTMPVNCENCNVGTLNPQTYEAHTLCPVCFERAEKGELTFREKVAKPKIQKIESPKVKESWRDRKARMHPQASKMEEALLLALNQKGLHPERDRQFCLRTTIPDFYFPHKNLAVYLDGEQVHKHPEKDQALREQLSKRYGIRVLTIPYASFTKTVQDEILQQIVKEVS